MTPAKTTLWPRVARVLNRPWPDLLKYVAAKVRATVWRSFLDQVGRGFHVCEGARFEGGRRIRIGERFYAGPHTWIQAVDWYEGYAYTPAIVIGSGVTCSGFVHISANSSITIGDGVLLGSKVHITDHAHGVYRGESQDDPETPPAQRRLSPGRAVQIGKNVWLGDGVVVLPGVVIGDGAVVGANSVVTTNIPAASIAVGAPARVVKRFDETSATWVAV